MDGADAHKEYVEKNVLSAIKKWYDFFPGGESRYLWYIYILKIVVL